MEGEGKRSAGRSSEGKKHFVLVHGLNHGAWCWYKLATLLRSEGHRVTALDLSACGVRPEKLISDAQSFTDYSRPFMDAVASLPEKEKVVLVGHSFGGISVAFAMEKFPEKISAAVFVAAFMPDFSTYPSYVLEQLFGGATEELLLDTQISSYQVLPEKQLTVFWFGPICMSSLIYQNCSPEDVTLGKMLVRPGSLYLEDLSKSPKLSTERYGSVKRVYVVCRDDKIVPEKVQLQMIGNNPPAEVILMEGSDHMPMLSKPEELCLILLNIARGA
ncbi:hypothetical protein H6P81_005467 [Aristolochia fimbriata]|uniref:AB hydrolase-1 domain-containing protein n=1 Tax=Aristolochia fimbriata TaxID=158543 RepID=A0AAV7EV19_ARIFI|nr:hypothetical protein H6P81_005467 [Aristolochia fimbriata]